MKRYKELKEWWEFVWFELGEVSGTAFGLFLVPAAIRWILIRRANLLVMWKEGLILAAFYLAIAVPIAIHDGTRNYRRFKSGGDSEKLKESAIGPPEKPPAP